MKIPNLHTTNLNRPARAAWRGLCLLTLALTLLIAPAEQATLAQRANTPEAVVAAFLSAWNDRDLATMYSYLSTQSKDFYAQQVFERRYQVANEAMRFTGVTYTIHSTRIQGISAAVTYDVVIMSSEFGELPDPNRTMRLVNNEGTWGIAWSSMDIFDALTADASISALGRLPQRGRIYDRNGNPIAQEGRVIALFVARQNMANEQSCINLMARLTRRPSLAFRNLINQFNPDTNFFLEELNEEVYNANRGDIDALCGVAFTRDRIARTYYGNNAMAHAIGFIGPITAEQEEEYRRRGYNSSDFVGQVGVERFMEQTLAGVPSRVLRITEPGGAVLRELASSQGRGSTSIVTTIDRDLQVAVAQAMADAYEYAAPNWGSVSAAGAAVVLDVNTGAVLALVSYPLVNPMLFDRDSLNPRRAELLGQLVADPREPLANHVTQNRYSPGSAYKVITAAAVLNEGIIAPEDRFFCDLYWDGRPLGDTRERRPDWRVFDGFDAAGDINTALAIAASCNPFFWEFGGRLYNSPGGRTKLVEYANALGLGPAYNLYPGAPEAASLLDIPPNVPSALNDAVGQGDVAIPPIQMAVATAAIANGGTVYRPFIVQQIGGVDGQDVVQRFEPTVLNTVDFEPFVLDTVRDGMCRAVNDDWYGTAYIRFRGANYTACGKTGTAQTGLYPNAWFISYAPAENPQIAVVVMVAQSLEGSQIAAPITRRIMDFYFNAPRIEPYPDWWAVGPYQPLRAEAAP